MDRSIRDCALCYDAPCSKSYRIIDDLLLGLKHYMLLRNYTSVRELIGEASESVVNTDELERDTVLFPRFDHDRCDGCGRCFISCRDGGHQAIGIMKKRILITDRMIKA